MFTIIILALIYGALCWLCFAIATESKAKGIDLLADTREKESFAISLLINEHRASAMFHAVCAVALLALIIGYLIYHWLSL